MQRLELIELGRKKMTPHDIYLRGLFWILREHGGHHSGTWPPNDLSKVSGWAVVRLLAFMSARSVRDVASDIIRYSIELDQKEENLNVNA